MFRGWFIKGRRETSPGSDDTDHADSSMTTFLIIITGLFQFMLQSFNNRSPESVRCLYWMKVHGDDKTTVLRKF